MKTSEKIRKYAPPVAGLIILGFGGFATAGLTFGAVIVIGSFICSMCLGSLFAAVGIAAIVGTSIGIHETRKVIHDEEEVNAILNWSSDECSSDEEWLVMDMNLSKHFLTKVSI